MDAALDAFLLSAGKRNSMSSMTTVPSFTSLDDFLQQITLVRNIDMANPPQVGGNPIIVICAFIMLATEGYAFYRFDLRRDRRGEMLQLADAPPMIEFMFFLMQMVSDADILVTYLGWFFGEFQLAPSAVLFSGGFDLKIVVLGKLLWDSWWYWVRFRRQWCV